MSFSALTMFILVQVAAANEPAPMSLPLSGTQAVDAVNGSAISSETPILTSKSETRSFVDQRNQKIELGPGSSAYFDRDGVFHLLRGSCILESNQNIRVQSANSSLLYRGRVLLSYDYKERSTSAFVLAGEATLANPNQGSSEQKLTRNQGSTLVSGDFYPSLLRNLDFTKVDSWLQRYGWSEPRRRELTANIPSSELAARLAALEARTTDSAKEAKVQRELASFFPVNADQEGPAKYEKEFTTSALTGKEHSAVETAILKGEEIQFLSPEQAAAIVLPNLGIQPDLKLHFEREDQRAHRKPLPDRLPASVKRTPGATAKRKTDSERAGHGLASQSNSPISDEQTVVTSTLNRLDEMERFSADKSPAIAPPAEFRFLEQNF